jgi:hypothetical protein
MEKSIYEQPHVEVIEVEVEQSFATSGAPGESPWEEWN